MRRAQWAAFGLVALAIAAVIALRGTQPTFTDEFYHFNAAARLVSGQGLTDAYLWTYIGAPESLPAPSHAYWMPLTSLTAALGMWLSGQPGSYDAAQIPFALMLWGTALVGFGLGGRIGGAARHAWLAGLLTLFSGFFVRFWGSIDTFAPYALVGSLALLALGLLTPPNSAAEATHRLPTPPVRERLGVRGIGWALLAGGLAALAHLTRADGVLLLLVGWAVVFFPERRPPFAGARSSVSAKKGVGWRIPIRRGIILSLVMTAAYLGVMSPWFARNVNAIGTPLPVGGAQGIWYTRYDDLFSYPPAASAATFFAENGVQRLVETRWLALTNNLGTFVAVEGWVVLAPLMLVGLWGRRRDPFVRGFWLYALGVHLVMTFVFPFPGYRGGLFHSAAALVPWWAALGASGLDDAVEWAAKRRRRWHAGTAKRVFSAAAVGFALVLSVSVGARGPEGEPVVYAELAQTLPTGATVMLNDPAALYYFTGLSGVVLPNEPPDVIPVIAAQYDVDYLLLTGQGGTPLPLWSLYETTPAWLTEMPFDVPGARLFRIDSPSAAPAAGSR